jgi:serine/threonine-protein kinase
VLKHAIPDHYKVDTLVGTGSAAHVYKAVHVESGKLLAIKQLHRRLVGKPHPFQRFCREALLMASLDHPQVLRCVDRNLDCKRPWFAMPYCPGGSIADQLVRSTLRSRQLLEYVLETLDALAYLHELGIVHRDVKPENILIDRHGTAQLADFGISRSPSQPSLVEEDTLGTPSFSAPEQLQNSKSASSVSDLYGLGATLYVCTLRKTAIPLLIPHEREARLDELPPPLRPIVRRATALVPSDRYPTAAAMADDIADLMECWDGGLL